MGSIPVPSTQPTKKMKQLYEANASSIISKNMHDEYFKKACTALLKKGYDISRISDSMIKKMSPQDAFKLKGKKGDKYFKFWFTKNNEFAFCTWANTMIDPKFRWQKSERAFPIGDYHWVDRYMRTNDTINELGYAYVIAFDDMPKTEELKKQRVDARNGATALMTDDQIRKTNFTRYQEILVKNNFSDGFEFSFIDNAIKPIKLKAFNRYSPFMTLYKWYDVSDYIDHYLRDLTSSIKIFQEYGYDLAQMPKGYSLAIDEIKHDFSLILTACNKMFNDTYYKNVLKYYKVFESTNLGKIDKFQNDILNIIGDNSELVEYITKYYVPALKYIFETIAIVNKSLIKAINGISNPDKLTIVKIEVFNDVCKKINYILDEGTNIPDKLYLYYLWHIDQLKPTNIQKMGSVIDLVNKHKLDKIPIYCKMLESLA